MALTQDQAEQAAEIIHKAFVARTVIDGLPPECAPSNAADAVLIQDTLLAKIGLPAAGYKAGFTNPPMLEKAGPDGPMAGVMFRDFTIPSGQSLRRVDVGTGALIEAEVAFQMARPLPVRDTPYTEDEVLEAVQSAIIAIEVAVPRFSNPLGQPIPYLAADNGAALAFVWGGDIPDWRTRDLKELDIALIFDGDTVSEGMPREARCDEVWALTWTVNHFAKRGIAIRSGDFITTGAAAAPKPLGHAAEVVARFDGIGDVSFTVAD
jgi:2-keto-4-pentenoate hydratase